MNYLRWSVALFFILTGSACKSASDRFGEEIFQQFEIGNSGKGFISDFRLIYGDITFPSGSNFTGMPAVGGTSHSEGRIVGIPEMAHVTWDSADGLKHEANVPIRSFIKDLSHFYGWQFLFVDDHLDVYLLSKDRSSTVFSFRSATKVFSK